MSPAKVRATRLRALCLSLWLIQYPANLRAPRRRPVLLLPYPLILETKRLPLLGLYQSFPAGLDLTTLRQPHRLLQSLKVSTQRQLLQRLLSPVKARSHRRPGLVVTGQSKVSTIRLCHRSAKKRALSSVIGVFVSPAPWTPSSRRPLQPPASRSLPPQAVQVLLLQSHSTWVPHLQDLRCPSHLITPSWRVAHLRDLPFCWRLRCQFSPFFSESFDFNYMHYTPFVVLPFIAHTL